MKIKNSEFVQRLEDSWDKSLFVCVGLDSDYVKLPDSLKKSANDVEGALTKFNQSIVDATAEMVCAYKVNSAFYEGFGLAGLKATETTIKYIKKNYPEVTVILDYKRGDIGNTNFGYVKYAFDVLDADAVTVNPYLGKEALKPFLDRRDKGIIVLARTSNPSAGEFQDLPVDLTKLDDSYKKKFGDMDELRDLAGQDVVKLYQIMAYRVSKFWNVYGNVGLVVGATYPEELAVVRRIVGDMPLLIPGVGTQGGDIEATVRAGMDSKKQGMIINSSRGIIFASKGQDFAEAARRETQRLTEEINKYR